MIMVIKIPLCKLRVIKVTPNSFYEISKMSDICSIFCKIKCVWMVHFALFLKNGSSKLRKFMNDLHEVLFKIFYNIFGFLKNNCKNIAT